ncbi:MAG: Acetyltransferase YpeA [Anaerolineales bacterium]|nr:Acetyltransferase YpeA [Anaerolineales bacterium]
MHITICEMTFQDYDEVLTLWQATEGVGLSEADSERGIAQFLQRNPGFSFVARDGDQLIGAVLCGHDGRRGFIHHLAVCQSYRRRGVGQALVEACLAVLRGAGIQKCHLFVFADNLDAMAFWERIGWQQRTELVIMSRYTVSANRNLGS